MWTTVERGKGALGPLVVAAAAQEAAAEALEAVAPRPQALQHLPNAEGIFDWVFQRVAVLCRLSKVDSTEPDLETSWHWC